MIEKIKNINAFINIKIDENLFKITFILKILKFVYSNPVSIIKANTNNIEKIVFVILLM